MNPNSQQKQVIDHVDGPCLVTAVPGSGKTASVTERIKRLIQLGKEPSSILAITFTNKAANEMKKRIADAVGKEIAGKICISTFHSMCARILRENARFVGLKKGYSIYDSDDQETTVKNVAASIWEDEAKKLAEVYEKRIEEAEAKGEDATKIEHEAGTAAARAKKNKPTDSYIKQILNYIEGKRNSCLSDQAAASKYNLVDTQRKIAKRYFEVLKEANAIDFTGLLSETIRLFKECPPILEKYQSQWKYINVDEVQDTNIAQYQIVKLLGQHGNVLAVGDPDQSIYAFRNANPENLLSFEKDFGAKWLKLETNYRSTPEILQHAHLLITKNSLRKDTVLRTDNNSGSPPEAYRYRSDYEMAVGIASEIYQLISRGVPHEEIAILYRVNHVSRILETELLKRRIKAKILGGVGFYDRKEVKTAMSVLRVLSNPSDRTAFDRIASMCCRGVGPKTISKVFDQAYKDDISILESARRFAEGGNRQAENLKVLTSNLRKDLDPGDALLWMLDRTPLRNKLEESSTKDNDRCENVRELAYDVKSYMNEGKSLDEYLQYISLITSSDETSNKEVLLMTMHASKGLEFDNVFISHANQSIIPHKNALGIEEEKARERAIEEERRLMYVAMTRARKNLRIYSCEYMAGRDEKGRISQFIPESRITLEARNFAQE